jgi:hypothetical protein
VLPEDSSGLFKAYLDATKRPHGYLLLDLTKDSEDRHRNRTNVFPHEYPPIIYVALDDEGNKGKLSHSTRVKNVKPKLRRSIISAGGKELINGINECALHVLVGNIPLSTCVKRKLEKHKLALRRLVDNRVGHSAKRQIIIQRGGFLLPLLTSPLPIVASVIFRSQST